MNLYRFSPIQNEEQLREAIAYVATQTSALSKKVIGDSLPVASLTIFAHYSSEYEAVRAMLSSLGQETAASNGIRIQLQKPVVVGSNQITHVRIRKPDPYRMQVGCADLIVPDYSVFKSEYLQIHVGNLRLIERSEYEMIEFFHPDFDVLAYVVSDKLHI